MKSLEEELGDEAARVRLESAGYSTTAALLDRAAHEIRHLNELVRGYRDLARGNGIVRK